MESPCNNGQCEAALRQLGWLANFDGILRYFDSTAANEKVCSAAHLVIHPRCHRGGLRGGGLFGYGVTGLSFHDVGD